MLHSPPTNLCDVTHALIFERVLRESHWAKAAREVLTRSDFIQGSRNPTKK
jgi:hypothetical protein